MAEQATDGTRAGDTAPGERRTFVLRRMALPMENEPYARYIAQGQEQLLPGESVTVVERAGGDEAAGFSGRQLYEIWAGKPCGHEWSLISQADRAYKEKWDRLAAALAPAGSPEAEPAAGLSEDARVRAEQALARHIWADFPGPGTPNVAQGLAIKWLPAVLAALAPAGSPEAEHEGTGAGE